MQEAKSRQTNITMPARKLRRVMKEVRGRIDGKVVSEVLNEELGRIL